MFPYHFLYVPPFEQGIHFLDIVPFFLDISHIFLRNRLLSPVANPCLVSAWSIIRSEESMTARFNVMKNYDIAGVAGWKLGLESDDIWPLIRDNF